MTIAEKTLAAYEKLVATVGGLERKGRAMPYTSVHGNMFSFLTKEGALALRLPQETRDELLKKKRAAPCEQHGKVLAEYVELPIEKGRPWFAQSFAYAKTLKPKKSAKKKKKK
jgi:hypothetical protein